MKKEKPNTVAPLPPQQDDFYPPESFNPDIHPDIHPDDLSVTDTDPSTDCSASSIDDDDIDFVNDPPRPRPWGPFAPHPLAFVHKNMPAGFFPGPSLHPGKFTINILPLTLFYLNGTTR